MNPLRSRKQLLLAESELNRALLSREWQTMADQVHGFAAGARTFTSMASAAATLVAGLGSCRCVPKPAASEKPSWFRSLLKNAGLIEGLWSAFRPPGRSEKK
jgi:hypothetical protein